MKLHAALALTLILPVIAATINYGSLEGQEEISVKNASSKSKTVKSKKTKIQTHSSSSKTSDLTGSTSLQRSTSTITATTTEKTITYAEDPLTTVTTTDELGRTTVKPLWWIPSEATTLSAETTASTESETKSDTAHKSTALGKLVSLNGTTESVISVQSNAGGNIVVNLGVAGSMAMVLVNLL